MQISHTELQRIRLLIWYPEKDTVPEKEMIESRRGQRLAFLRKMIERITGVGASTRASGHNDGIFFMMAFLLGIFFVFGYI